MPILTLNQVSRIYGPYRAVDCVDLVVRDGELVSLLGPAGSGKTTLVRMIAGLVTPTGGSIIVDGRVVSSTKGATPPEARGMAMVFQSGALWPTMSVTENVAFGLRLRHVSHADMARRVTLALDRVEMHHLAGRMPAQLSAAQKQRVALARAVVIEPSILLLDEPLQIVDTSARDDLIRLVRSLHEVLHLTTIYVTGEAREATLISDRIAMMNRGRFEQVDTPQALYTQPRTRFVAALSGPTNFLEGRRRGNRIVFDGFSIEAVRLGKIDANADPLMFSLRPQNLVLQTANATPQPASDDVVTLDGRIQHRTFAGHHWDYVIAVANSALRLDITAPLTLLLEPGDAARVALDPTQLIAVR